jgi:hypothetical protein
MNYSRGPVLTVLRRYSLSTRCLNFVRGGYE